MDLLNKPFKCVVFVFCTCWLLKEVLLPLFVAVFSYYPFMELVQKCDSAMASSWYINQLPDEVLGKSEQVQLLDCHEYDKLRKVMLFSGLPENYLSYLGLIALEIHQRPAQELVDQHRFKER